MENQGKVSRIECLFACFMLITVAQIFAGYNYDPLIATAPHQADPVGSDFTMTGAATGGSGQYSYKWYLFNSDGTETLVSTSASYHVGIFNEVTTRKYRFVVTDTQQSESASVLPFLVAFSPIEIYYFDEDFEEVEPALRWHTVTASDVFTEPAFTGPPSSLRIQGVDSNTYGFWESVDLNDMKEQPLLLYMGRYLVNTSVTDQTKVPCTRLRMNRWLGEIDPVDLYPWPNPCGGASIRLNSHPSVSDPYIPTLDGRYLDFFYAPSFRMDQEEHMDMVTFTASIDFINIGTEDEATGITSLEEYAMIKKKISELPDPTGTPVSFDFDTDTEGWDSGNAEPEFDGPVSTYESGCLKHYGTTTNTFGWWESDDLTYEKGYLYCASFDIFTDVVEEENVPTMRLRANIVNGCDWGHVYSVNSDEDATLSPTPETRTYQLFYLPPQRSANNTYRLYFDYVNIGEENKKNTSLYLEKVEIEKISLADFNMPSPEVPAPESPDDGATDISLHPTLTARRRLDFTINPTPTPTGNLQYTFELARDASFANPVMSKTATFNTYTETISVTGDYETGRPLWWLFGDDTCYWRVKSTDGKGDSSAWSDVRSFHVDDDNEAWEVQGILELQSPASFEKIIFGEENTGELSYGVYGSCFWLNKKTKIEGEISALEKINVGTEESESIIFTSGGQSDMLSLHGGGFKFTGDAVFQQGVMIENAGRIKTISSELVIQNENTSIVFKAK